MKSGFTVKNVFQPVKIHIDMDEKHFLKDPLSSELGSKIIRKSIEMIDEIGFESFTFKKLSVQIGASEPSVYRYFENKHKLLLYLLAWYWNWMDYKLILATDKVASAQDRLRISLELLCKPIEKDPNFDYIDETALYRIVVSESSKVYLIKEVDRVNKDGLFISYKRLCNRVAAIVKEINPEYRFPKALISTIVESSHDQKFFAAHLPALTDIQHISNDTTKFLMELVQKTIQKG